MRSRLNRIRNVANSQNLNISIIKNNKERSDSLKARLDSIDEVISLSNFYANSLHNILITTRDKYAEYQRNRVGFAENSLKENIDFLFPDRGFTPIIDYEFSRNNVKCSLTLRDKNNNIRKPKITEGGFLKQLIGYTSAISILRLLGSKTFYIDEAFSQASSDSKDAMQNIIYNYTKNDGIQTILISQSPECYYQLPRREFRLEFLNDKCHLKSVQDFDLEFESALNDLEDDSDELKSDGDFSVLEEL